MKVGYYFLRYYLRESSKCHLERMGTGMLIPSFQCSPKLRNLADSSVPYVEFPALTSTLRHKYLLSTPPNSSLDWIRPRLRRSLKDGRVQRVSDGSVGKADTDVVRHGEKLVVSDGHEVSELLGGVESKYL